MSTTTHLITADELIKLPRGQYRYELIKGELLTMSPTGFEHGELLLNLGAPLRYFVKQHKLGRVAGGDAGFKLESNPDTVLAPDISFVKEGRLKGKWRGYPVIVPDLVVEVISPSERKSKVIKKTEQWLSFGVESVWLVRPDKRKVEVFSKDGTVRVFGESEILTDSVVPRFEIPVSSIFE